MTVVPESKVLRHVDKRIHSDDWPIYHLRKVNVVSQQTQQCVSLLESHKDHAVQVTGVFEAKYFSVGHEANHRRPRTQHIEINNVSFWAFSQEADKSVSLWASGKAGWFELHDPEPQYRDIFEGMNEAVSMLYYLADKWRRSRKGHSCVKVKELERYVVSVFRDFAGSGRDLKNSGDAEACTQKFHRHAQFLITSMLEGQDNLDWQRSPFLRYFQHFFQVRHPAHPEFGCTYGELQDVYEETESRLYPPRYPKLGRTKLATQEHRRKTLTSKTVPAQHNGHTRSHRTRRSNRDEAPQTPLQPDGNMNDTDTSGDEEQDSNGNLIRAGTKRKSKSILRPKASKFSKKNTGRRASLPALVGDMERLDSISDAEDKVSETSPLAAVAARETPQQVTRDGLRETRYPYYGPRNFTEVKMVSYGIPSDQPQGPGDLWTCAFENCNRRVHEASKPKGKAQIKEHFQDHARQAQEKIDLALSEARPYLPVK
ncbi:MAG: hypothetical protein Q9197_001057 [Variospora fuerteventurae]